MEKKLEKLKNWGCDVSGALERFLNDQKLYCECLNMFIEDDNFVSLRLHINNTNQEIPFGYVHTLKGVAGNLGLTPLYHSLCELCDALRTNSYSPNSGLYERTVTNYKLFLEIMK